MKLREWRLELAIFVVVLIVNLAWLGRVGLFNVDEAIFGEATREMVASGDYITPTYNGANRWDKPPLIYWVMSVPMRVFGPTAFASRFHSAAAGAMMVLLLMVFGRAVFGRRAGVLGGTVFATCLYGFYLAHWGATDLVLSLLMALGWMALWLSAEHQSPKWFVAAGVALGLATLVKGPVALVLPGFTWLVYLVWRRDVWRTLVATRCWWGILVYVAVVTPWCIAIYQAHGTAFFESFLGWHNLNRLTSTQSGHGGPFWTFVPIAVGGLAPWSGYGVWGLLDAFRRRRSDEPANRAAFYLLLWFLVVLGVFSISQTKLPSYIAPLFPAFALLAGRVVARDAFEQRLPRRQALWLWAGNVVVPALIGVGLMLAHLWLPRLEFLQRELGGTRPVPGMWPGLAGMVMVTGAAVVFDRRLRDALWAALAVNTASGLLGGLAIWLAVAPMVYHYQEGTLRSMILVASEQLAPDDRLGVLNVHLPSVAFYSHRQFHRYIIRQDVVDRETEPEARAAAEAAMAAERQALAESFAAPGLSLLITQPLRTFDALDGIPHYVWASRNGYALVANQQPPVGFELPRTPWTEYDVHRLRSEEDHG